jgi:response regulator RpfG family c-di-GMP phosphodiesterase
MVIVLGLYFASDYRVKNHYVDYTREKWFVAFLIGYTLEFICFVLGIYAVTKRIENIIAELSEQNQRVINMQNDVIAGFAGLVESRDNHTGEHVKRTADTVKLIMQSMFENNIYEGKIDEKDARIIEMAAPLHDIGKIKIPDAILCKPAKLTEEEFGKMKYHTNEGKTIIDKYLEKMEEAEFIDTARDIVLSHHERWDGKGYPNNLKGEEIPISARIMAVADVFDALISKRCYKEAFSFEESFKIIMEGSGTQFDPEIVKALKLKEKELMELYAHACEDKEDEE